MGGTGATDLLALLPWSRLSPEKSGRVVELGTGSFGTVVAMQLDRAVSVAVKCNGIKCTDGGAVDNERKVMGKLLVRALSGLARLE